MTDSETFTTSSYVARSSKPGLAFGAIMPHGDVIPAISTDYGASSQKTNDAMEQIGQAFRDAAPDVLLLLTPHGVRVESSVTVSVTERASGELIGNDASIRVDLPVHQFFALSLASRAGSTGVPVSTVIFGSAAGEGSTIPLDWGSIIPLWYLTNEQPEQQSVVIAAPSRSVGVDLLYKFGRAAAEAARDSGLRLAVVASADWSHTHSELGPYGFSPAAAEMDRLVLKAVETNDLRSMGRFSDKLIEDAKPDGIWQSIVLAGALETTGMVGRLLSYEVPSYFGMLCALYVPNEVQADSSSSGPS